MATAEHLSIHEAAHGAIQWFVGWEEDIQHIWMGPENESAVGPAAGLVANPPTIDSLSDVRKRILVLLAGSRASELHCGTFMNDFDGDWLEILKTLSSFFEKATFLVEQPFTIQETEPNECLQEASDVINAMLSDTRIMQSVNSLAATLRQQTPKDGKRLLSVEALVEVCEHQCGAALRDNNSWNDWLNP